MLMSHFEDLTSLTMTLETVYINQIDGLVQDCSNSIVDALELLQSCTKPSKYCDNSLVCTINSLLACLYYV